MKSILTIVGWFLCLVFLSACSNCDFGLGPRPQPPPPLPEARIDSGFQLDRDAFSFPNFGGESSLSKIDADLMKRLYGRDSVCLEEADGCRLRPIARKYMKAVNDAMKGGRCEGFAMLAGLMQQGDVSVAAFGEGSAAELLIEDNGPLNEEIAYWFMTQYLMDVVAETTEALDAESVVRKLSNEWSGPNKPMFRVGMLRLDENNRLTGGHAVLPLAIEPGEDDGKYVIYVYDNNIPGEEREIHVDISQNEWRYEASSNPAEQSALYSGNSDNENLLYVSVITPRSGIGSCAFCEVENEEAVLQQVFGSGSIEFSVASGGEELSGEKEGRIYQEIPGSTCAPVFSAENYEDDTPLQCFFPADAQLEVFLQPSGTPEQVGEQSLGVFNEGFAAGLGRLGLLQRETAVVRIDKQSQQLGFTPPSRPAGGGGGQARINDGGPQLNLSVHSNASRNSDFDVVVTLPPEGVSQASLEVIPDNGNPRVDVTPENAEAPVETVAMTVEVASEDGVAHFTGDVPVDGAGATELRFDEWAGEGEPVAAEIDTNGDGQSDFQEPVADQGEDPLPPEAPSDLELQVNDARSVTLSWSDNSSNEGKFEVERSEGAGFAFFANVIANVTELNDSSISRGSSYQYRVRATNAYGASAYTNLVEYASPACEPGEALANGACVSCVVGEYCPGGTSGAETCPPGTQDADEDATTPCETCASGTYCAGGDARAETCAGGTTDDDNDPATSCAACATGEYCAGSDIAPVSCPAGTHDDDLDPATDCAACQSGSYCAGGANPAELCAAGTHDDDEDPSTPCASCAIGEYCAGGTNAPVACESGTHDDDENPSTACVECAVGSYCAGGASAPEACAVGTHDDDSDPSTPCFSCSAGQYCAGGSAALEICPAGTYDDDSSATTPCLDCGAGEFCAGADAAPAPCEPGTQDDDQDPATVCEECAVGEYCGGGALLAESCDSGTHDDDQSPATPCVACELGTYCAGGDAAPQTCAPGTSDHDTDAATQCETCGPGAYCIGGANPATYCEADTEDADRDPTTPCTPCEKGLSGYGGSLLCGGVAQSCLDIKQKNPSATSGLYAILPPALAAGGSGFPPFEVYCEMELGGGGWTLIINRNGDSNRDSVESCGQSLDGFLTEGCGQPSTGNAADSYAMSAPLRSFLGATEMLVVQSDETSTVDTDDAFIVTLSEPGQDLFPSSDGGNPTQVHETSVSRVCDINNDNCDDTDVVWRYTGLGSLENAQCNGINPGASSGGGMYGLCHNGSSAAANPDKLNSLFGDRDGFDEVKLWGGNKPSRAYQEHIFYRSPIVPPRSCLEILRSDPLSASGEYEIDPDGLGPAETLTVYCDMSTDGGGYTYFAIENGLRTFRATDLNSCQLLGLEMVVPRSQAHWASLFEYEVARNQSLGIAENHFTTVPGIFKPTDGGDYSNYVMRYGSVPDWSALDGRGWWLRDSTYAEPNGDYTAYCWLRLENKDVNDLRFDDSNCDYSTVSYICSTNDHDPVGCEPGTYDDDGNPGTSCAPCAAGQYCEGGVSPPVACTPGTVDADFDPATPCLECLTGSYCPGGDAGMSFCPQNTEDHDEDPSTECQPCDIGTFSNGGEDRCVSLPASCQEILRRYETATSGIYLINPDPFGLEDPFEVYCEMELSGGGWTLVANRRGGVSNVEACGNDLNEFFTNGCGSVYALEYNSSYALNANQRSLLRAKDVLVVQYDNAGNADLDDAYTLGLKCLGQELFPDALSGGVDLDLFSACDLDEVDCSGEAVRWRYSVGGYFENAGCDASFVDGTSSAQLGSYGLCVGEPGGQLDSYYGDRSGFAQTKLWNWNADWNGGEGNSALFQERIFYRSEVSVPVPNMLWLDASNMDSMSLSESNELTLAFERSSNALLLWPGYGSNYEAAPEGAGPQWVADGGPNGKPTLRFDTGRLVSEAARVPNESEGMTGFAVLKMDVGNGISGSAVANQNQDTYWALRELNNTDQINFQIQNNNVSPVISYSHGDWMLLWFKRDGVGTSMQDALHSDGFEQTNVGDSLNADKSAPDTPITIGTSFSGTNNMNGDLSELRLYYGALAPNEIELIVEELKIKWGFAQDTALQDNDQDGICSSTCAQTTCDEGKYCYDGAGTAECLCESGTQDYDFDGVCAAACGPSSCEKGFACDDSSGATQCVECGEGNTYSIVSGCVPCAAGEYCAGGNAFAVPGLVMNLDAAGYGGSGPWLDTSSNGFAATLVQSPTYQTDEGGYFQLDGGTSTGGNVDSFAVADGTALDAMNAITIEMWIQLDSVSTTPQYLFSKRTSAQDGYVGYVDENGFTFRFGTGVGQEVSWRTTPVIGEWQQIVVMVDGNGASIYRNGNLVTGNAYVGDFQNIDTGAELRIGDVNGEASGQGLQGKLSAFRIYNQAVDSFLLYAIYQARK